MASKLITISAAQVISYSTYYGTDYPRKAVDGIYNSGGRDYWYVYNTAPPSGGHFIVVDLLVPTKITQLDIIGMFVSGSTTALKNWTILGSNDNSTWNSVYTGLQANNTVLQSYTMPAGATAYRYWKFSIQSSYYAANGYTGGVSELLFYGEDDGTPNITPTLGTSFTNKNNIKLTGSIDSSSGFAMTYQVRLNGTELINSAMLPSPITMDLTFPVDQIIYGTNNVSITALTSNGKTATQNLSFTVAKDTVTNTISSNLNNVMPRNIIVSATASSTQGLVITNDVYLDGTKVGTFNGTSGSYTFVTGTLLPGSRTVSVTSYTTNSDPITKSITLTILKDVVTITNVSVPELSFYKKVTPVSATISSSGSFPMTYDVLMNGVIIDTITDIVGPKTISYNIPPTAMTDGSNIVSISVRSAYSDPKSGSTTFYAYSTALLTIFDTYYPFRFLSTPKNPQAELSNTEYVARYMNSEPAVSAMFRYKPFNVIDNTLIEPAARVADMLPKRGQKLDVIGVERVNEHVGIQTHFNPIAIARRRLEGLIGNAFFGIIERSTGLIQLALGFEKEYKQMRVDYAYAGSRKEYLDSIGDDNDILTGFRPDEEAFIRAYAIGAETETVFDGILRAFQVGSREISAPMIEIGKLIVSEMKYLNDDVLVVQPKVAEGFDRDAYAKVHTISDVKRDRNAVPHRISLAERLLERISFLNRNLTADPNQDREAQRIELRIMDTVYETVGLRMQRVDADSYTEVNQGGAILTPIIFGDKIRSQGGVTYNQVAERPDYNGYISRGLLVERTDYYGHINDGFFTEREDYRGIIYDGMKQVEPTQPHEGAIAELIAAERPKTQSIAYDGYHMIHIEGRQVLNPDRTISERWQQQPGVVSFSSIFTPQDYHQGAVARLISVDGGQETNEANLSNLIIADIADMLQAARIEFRYADNGRSKTALVYNEMLDAEGNIAKNSIMANAGQKLTSAGIIKNSIIERIRAHADGIIVKRSVLVRTPAMAEGNKTTQGVRDRVLSVAGRVESQSLSVNRYIVTSGEKTADATLEKSPIVARYKVKAPATIERRVTLVSIVNRDTLIVRDSILTNRQISDATLDLIRVVAVDIGIDSVIAKSLTMSNAIGRDILMGGGTVFSDSIGKNTKLIMHDQLLSTPERRNSDYHFIDTLAVMTPRNSVISELQKRVTRLQREGFIQYVLIRMEKIDKVGLITKFWNLFNRISLEAHEYERQAYEASERSLRSSQSMIYDFKDYEKTVKEDKDFALHRFLMYEKVDLDSIIVELMGLDVKARYESVIEELALASRPQEEQSAIKIDQRVADIPKANEAMIGGLATGDRRDASDEAIKIVQPLSEREEVVGLVQRLIIAHDEDKYNRPALSGDGYKLVGDRSGWDDIWTRFSEGQDIIDVPTSDFDYEKLVNQVYDPETGVPRSPRGPTNKADVKVKTPLHHPLPANFDIGLEEAVVDNFILIDVILAVETLKNRASLRYAGMPAERAVREVMSKLFAWVREVAADSREYDRTFRLVRWYAESAVLGLSEHILHRTYLPWKSRIHANEDLGLDYDSTGWRYFANQSVIQTTTEIATLTFEQAMYIDASMTVRGFIDNPNGEARFQIKVDGVTLAEFDADDNGAFTVTFDVPAGHHTFEFAFQGTSGRISLSSMEIGGVVFTGAFTTSDDSNTNGLKALTTLMTMLLSYYDIHHGDGKIKGAMAVKQRKVWNQT